MSAFPTVQDPKSDNLISNQPVIQDVSSSGKRQARIADAHLWEYKATYPPMEVATFAPVYAFSASLRGASFTITIPQKVPIGVVSGSISVLAAQSAGINGFVFQGFAINATDVFKAGDIIKFAGHDKVYMVTADASSDAFGLALVFFNPPLVSNVATSEVITYTDVPFTMAFKKDIVEWKTSRQGFSTFSINLIEAL